MNVETFYHKVLRVSALVFALVLLFDSGVLISHTRELSLNTQRYVAAVSGVGVGASVESNEYNTLAEQLAQRARQLDAREREINARVTDTAADDVHWSTYVLSVMLFFLLVLIVLNYAFDWMRARRNAPMIIGRRRKTLRV